MPKFSEYVKGLFGGGSSSPSFMSSIKDFLIGTPEIRENLSTLRPEQESLYQQLQKAGIGRGAGGAFGDTADYYRDLLSDDSSTYSAMASPEMRRYSQDIVPSLSEQFAGMGSGGLSSSGFRNAQIQGATDLSERLGSLRAQLRQAGAQGLQGIGQAGLGQYSQNMITDPGSEGFLSQLAPAAGNVIGAYFGGPLGASAGYKDGNWLSGSTKIGKNTSPYGSGMSSTPASPSFQRSPLPTFNPNMRR